ncbi:2-aminoethylphosphonate--pyruvate transaminase [Stella sp.]|uniref:2-aminoethylphosphonate--pyruvate transaminase n=1 Tax=Stella sp. TaxID=2912054 RepID=UPI0035ADAA88
MTDPTQVPLLLTPGPLTTSETTKRAMLRDWGSRDGRFVEMNARIRARLVELAGGGDRFVTIPIQGSGTFAVEAMLGTMLPKDGRILLAINGAYGHRMARIVEMLGRSAVEYETAEDTPIDAAEVGRRLDADPGITHVAVVYCETTSGVLNPVAAIAEEVARRGRRLLIDAMSAFGALPLDVSKVACDAVAASSNKCLEGVPGMGFVIARREAIAECEGNAHALSLDLHDQWRFMERAGQWRFTPPTHVIAAFDQALTEHAAEGGVEGRGGRYRENCRILVGGMRAMGFETLLPDALQAPIIVTFHMPADPAFAFQTFYDRLRDRGFVIYPGKLTVADSFRIGCIGRLMPSDMQDALAAIAATLAEMGVTNCGPLPVARRAVG